MIRVRTGAVVFILALTAWNCDTETGASSTEALHGSSVIASDPASQAVGVINIAGSACSASLILEDGVGGIGLTAAHCVFKYAQRCATMQQTIAGGVFAISSTSGTISSNGSLSGATDIYAIDALLANPAAFSDLGRCATEDPFNCAKSDDNTDSDRGHDLAIFHFRGGNNLPSHYGIQPLKVITSITGGSGAFGLHPTLNQAIDFSTATTVRGFPVGWGNDDIPGPNAERHAGVAAFELSTATGWVGPNWDDVCYGPTVDCKGNPIATSCGGNSGFSFEKIVYMDRLSNGDGTFTGVAASNGDSGGPLLVEAGFGASELPDLGLPQGTRAIFGVYSGGNAQVGDGVTLSPSYNEEMVYAPTYEAANGTWIENSVTQLEFDLDGDGIPGFADNCPLVANPLQENTNYLAEYQDEQNRGCVDFPGDVCPALHALPTADDAMAAAFHATFPGDACDPAVSTETGRTGITFGDGVVGPPCVVVQISGNQTSSHVDLGSSCEHQLNTQLRLSSWVGDNSGNAPTAGDLGKTSPTFCRCDGATSATDGDQAALDCSTSTPQGGSPCIVANDRTLPGGSLNTSSGWRTITERIIAKNIAYDLAPFPNVQTAFQERVDTYPDLSATHNWNMLTDWGVFNSGTVPPLVTLEGVMWSHVGAFNGTSVFASARGSSNLVTNLDNHYFTLLGTESFGLRFQVIVPPAFHFHIGGWFDGVDGDPGPGDPVFLPWLAFTSNGDVVRLIGSAGSIATSSFTSPAISLLSGVANGTADLLVGA